MLETCALLVPGVEGSKTKVSTECPHITFSPLLPEKIKLHAAPAFCLTVVRGPIATSQSRPGGAQNCPATASAD